MKFLNSRNFLNRWRALNQRICAHLTSLKCFVWSLSDYMYGVIAGVININPRGAIWKSQALSRYLTVMLIFMSIRSESQSLWLMVLRLKASSYLSSLEWMSQLLFLLSRFLGWKSHLPLSRGLWVAQCVLISHALLAFPILIWSLQSSFQANQTQTHTSVAFSFIKSDQKNSQDKFCHAKVHTHQWVLKNGNNKIPLTEPFTHWNPSSFLLQMNRGLRLKRKL